MIRILALILALTTSAFAQSGSTVKQSGYVTPTHAACWTTNGIVQDCGTAAIPYLTTVGTVGQGPTNCAWTALVTSGAAQQICLGGTTSGGAEIYVQNYGTASALPLVFDINGNVYQFPYTIGGIVGPNSSVLNGGVCWGNTSGTLAENCPGVISNVLNSQTSNYSIATTDCGKTIQAGTGSSGFFTITVPSVSGFPSTCVVVITDGDTGRGKAISGDPGCNPINHVLYPEQTCLVGIVNGAWAALSVPGRYRLTGSTTFHVSASGSSTNDGLAADNGAFGGLSTGNIAAAVTSIAQLVDANLQPIALQLDDCSSGAATYSGDHVVLPPVVGANGASGLGGNSPTVIGNTTTPDDCTVSSTSGPTFVSIQTQEWIVEGVKIQNTTTNCVYADAGGWIRLAFIDFNNCDSGSAVAMVAGDGGLLEISGNVTISASMNCVVDTTNGGKFLYGAGTITLSGTPAWGTAFACTTDLGFQSWASAMFSGTSTGVRYNATLNGVIDTNGGGATFLPGNSSGSATTGAQYN